MRNLGAFKSNLAGDGGQPAEAGGRAANYGGTGAEGQLGDEDPFQGMAVKASIKAAHEKANRLIKQARLTIEDVSSAIQLGGDRMRDRTNEETSLKKVAATELEITQTLALLPYSPEMYEYKINQVNQVIVD